MLKRANPRVRRVGAWAIAIAVVGASIGSRLDLYAAGNSLYGIQYRQGVTYNAALQGGSTPTSGVLATGAADARNFHPSEYATVYVPCNATTVVVNDCVQGNITEAPTEVLIDSVNTSTGAIAWSPFSSVPGNPTRIESHLSSPGGASADASGNFYVGDLDNNRIAVFGPSGAPLFTLGTFGQIYTLDADGIYPDPQGDCLDQWYQVVAASECPNDPTKKLGKFYFPGDVAVSADGMTIYVADTYNHRIQIFKRNDSASLTAATTVVASNGWRFVASSLGSFGVRSINNPPALDKLSNPNGVDFNATTGRIAIADSDNGRIIVLDKSATGAFRTSDGVRYTGFQFGRPGNSFNPPIQDELNYPYDVKLASNDDGRIIVADTYNNQVKVFDATGAGVAIIGDGAGGGPGEFKTVAGVDVYANGDILVSDADNGRLQLLKKGAGTQYTVGAEQFASVSSPYGVAVIPSQQRIAVAEWTGSDFASLGPLALQVTSVSAPSPSTVYSGSPTVITFVVTNSGLTPLTEVQPIASLLPPQAPACPTGIGDAAPVDLAPGASHAFTVCATGSVPGSSVTVNVAATAEGSGFVYTSPSMTAAPFTVIGQNGPSLLLNASGPSIASVDSTFAVSFAVTNNGSVALTNVALSLTQSTANATLLTAQTSAAQLAIGQTTTFTATYKAVANGPFSVTGSVTAAETTEAQTRTVDLTVKDDTAPPQPVSFLVRGPGGQLPNGDGWVQDPTNQGATITATIADQGSMGLSSISYAVLGQQFVSVPVAPGTPALTFTTIPVRATGQGRVIVAFWADDTGHNGRDAGIYPGAATGSVVTTPTALAAYCAAFPQWCAVVNVDNQAPQLAQELIEISADHSEARVHFHAIDAQSDVASVTLTAGVQQNATARLEMEPNSNSRGALVLTAKGTTIWGKITVVDHAGFVSEFTLPFAGPNDPPLRLDATPPEAFNRLDPWAVGATCVKTGTLNVPLFTYPCANKVYGTDDLPGLTTSAFEPLSSVPTIWGNGEKSADGLDRDFAGNAQLLTYSFTDEFTPASGPKPIQNPNKVTLVEKTRQNGQEARVRVISYQYNAGPIVTPDWAYKKYEWANTTKGDFKTLNQKFEIGRGLSRVQVLANWDASKNQTTIRELGPRPEKRIVVPGLILLRMTTKAGALVIEYDVTKPVAPPRPLTN